MSNPFPTILLVCYLIGIPFAAGWSLSSHRSQCDKNWSITAIVHYQSCVFDANAKGLIVGMFWPLWAPATLVADGLDEMRKKGDRLDS